MNFLEDLPLNHISDEDTLLDRIPDGDLALNHAHVRGQQSDLAISNLDEELKVILKWVMIEADVCKRSLII